MAQLGEEIRKIRFKTGCSLAGLGLSINSVRIVEAISEPFQVDIELFGQKAPKDISLKSLIGSDAGLLIGNDHGWHGIVRSFSYVSAMPGGGENVHTYRAVIVPKLWRLTLNTRQRVFFDVTTSDIVTQILSQHGLPAPKNSSLLNKGKHEYCTQFEETDLAFVARLLAEEGISYRFDNGASQSELALLKAPDSQSVTLSSEQIKNLSFQSTLHSGVSHTFDFDDKEFRAVGWTAKSKSPFAHAASEVWDFGRGRFAKASEGVHTYDAAHGEADAKALIAQLESSSAGAVCSFDGDPLLFPHLLDCIPGVQIAGVDALNALVGSMGIKLLMLRREFAFSEGYEGGSTASVKIQCAQAVDHWAPPRSERPRPPGLCSGVVTAVKASESDTAADPHRMVKVKFPWADPELSSCWLRVAQVYAGRGWGASFVPRINQEVLVEFLNGDIDRPVVVGSLYNGKNNGPAYTSTQSGFKTEGSKFNELRFDDKADAQEVYLEAGKNLNYLVHENETGTVEKDYTLTVKGKQDTTVEGDQAVVVKKTRKDTTTQAHSIESNDSINLKVGGCSIKIDTSGITIEAMGNKITLDSGGVTVKGTVLKLNSQSTAELKANASVTVEGSGMAELKSSGMTTVKGSMTMIN